MRLQLAACRGATLNGCRPPVALQVGDRITAGDIYATVKENTLMDHKVRQGI